jgi:L-lactate utilization protein LutC
MNTRAEQDQLELKEKASAQLMQSHKTHLILLAKPFVWALRTELLNKNLGQVNQYLNEMVKEKGMLRIMIANPKGTIIASTNKKDEGQPFTSVGNQASLTTDEISVEVAKDSTLVMTSPIMGFNNRLGTLLIKYSASNP